jgi:hypothetical protein
MRVCPEKKEPESTTTPIVCPSGLDHVAKPVFCMITLAPPASPQATCIGSSPGIIRTQGTVFVPLVIGLRYVAFTGRLVVL